jgi:hypothetical protein
LYIEKHISIRWNKLPFNDNASQVNPLPNAAKTTVSPDFPFSHASVKAIGIVQSCFRTFVYCYTLDHRLTQISFE